MRTISRDDFRSLFALYACAGRPSNGHNRAPRLLKLLTPGQDTSDDLLDHWSERIEAPGPEIVGGVLSGADDNTNHDHASAFLHALLKELEQRQH
ncbi:hypothetical protein ACVTD1_11110 [Bradyrhizobium ottawaense]